MGQINLGRVILGGFAAGIVIDVFEGLENGALLSDQWNAVMASLNRTPDFSAKQLVAFNLMGLLMGIVLVWLYAALRARFGAGPKTALIAAVVMWLAGDVLGSGFTVLTHIFPVGLSLIGICVGLVELVLGALVGAKLYKDQEAERPLTRAANA